MDSDDLVSDQLQNTVDDGLKALKDLFVGKRHIALLDAGIWEVGLNADIYSPLLSIVSEIGLNPVLKVHNTLRIHLTCRAGPVRELHLTDFRTKDVAEVPIESR